MNPFPGTGKWRVMSQERPHCRKHSRAKFASALGPPAGAPDFRFDLSR